MSQWIIASQCAFCPLHRGVLSGSAFRAQDTQDKCTKKVEAQLQGQLANQRNFFSVFVLSTFFTQAGKC